MRRGVELSHAMETQFLVALRRIARGIDLRSRQLLVDFGLTAPQLAVLQTVSRLQPVKASRLAQEVLMGQPTVTGVLKRLESRGLVTRHRGAADRREINVNLTDKGAQVLADAPPLLQTRFRTALAAAADWEQTMLLSGLQRIAAMMDVDRELPDDELPEAECGEALAASPRAELFGPK
jgi:DNA-binding MarR family transcriptional regulator